ncbi:MAG: MFS transporter [Candidatus Binataceae bacterium]
MEHGNALTTNATTQLPRYSRGVVLFVMIFCPLLNSVAGIVIDLYAPSMPAIGREFDVSPAAMQYTVVITTFGYAIGQLLFGVLSDWKGRRLTIILGLFLFCLGSIFAMQAHSLEALLLARALQGFSVGSCQVVARAVVVDSLSGRRFEVAVIYLSVAFAIGLIAGPYVGGAIQQTYGWRANFAFYAAYGGLLLLASAMGLRETLPTEARSTPAQLSRIYKVILQNSAFLFSTLQLGLCFIGFTLWNQIGPDTVERLLAHSPRYFGATALTVGVGYLFGTVTNRLLVSVTSDRQRLWGSNIVFALGALTISLSGAHINLLLIIPGVMLCAFSQGVVFPNVLSRALSCFPDRAGIAASLLGFGMLIVGSGGLALVSLIEIHSGMTVAALYGSLCAAAILSLLLSPRDRKSGVIAQVS